ncbi:MAG: protein kinase [Actinomycetota bacterium]|nr:protein kinase [Actinomycetota bacterium]
MEEPSADAGGLRFPGIQDLQPIGRGGFATVYRGWQEAFHRAVAVKVIDANPNDPAVPRFRKELKALGSLSGHPHVVPVYAAGIVNGCPYLVMPFLSGGSLADRIRSGPLPPEETIRLGIAMADALTAAHKLGLLHRDVKPANILNTAYGASQLGDFGIARFADSTVTNGQMTATVGYAAPEVLAGERATEASDVYSLGATLYAALRGAAPFAARDGEPLIALAVRSIGEVPDNLRELGVPPRLATVVDRAMAKDPSDRYPTAAALGAALQSIDLRPTSVAPPTQKAFERPLPPAGPLEPGPVEPDPVDQAPPNSPSRRPGRALAGTLAVLLVAGLGLAALLNQDHPAKSARSVGPRSTSAPLTTVAPQPSTTSTSTTSTSATLPAPAVAPKTTTPPATKPVAPTTTSPPTTQATGTPLLVGSSLTQTVRSYYSLVNQHRLTESFGWLSPAYQQRLGFANYQSFWQTIASVDVLDVSPGNNSASMTLRYNETNGTISTEHVSVTFITDPATGKLLIDTYQ